MQTFPTEEPEEVCMTVTAIMSPVWVKLAALLCLSCTVLSGPAENSEVLWRDVGGSITIQCRGKIDQQMLYVKRGLKRDEDIFLKMTQTDKTTITESFKGRLQVNGNFPNMDIFISNLTTEDTGPYWCVYKTMDTKVTDGTGSVLLVVKDDGISKETCDLSKNNLVMVSIVISAAVLLCIIMGILMWLIKTKMPNARVKSRHIPNNDVYEDMRGTIRR